MSGSTGASIVTTPFLQDIVHRVLRNGATDAEARGREGRSLTMDVSNAALQSAEQAEESLVEVTAYFGLRRASLTVNDATVEMGAAIARVVDMARLAPEDPYCGLAPQDGLCQESDERLQLCDPSEPSSEQLRRWAFELEAGARSIEGVNACDTAAASWTLERTARVASNGVDRTGRRSLFSIQAQVVAGAGDNKEAGGSVRSARWAEDLPTRWEVGVEAGRKTVAKLGARKIDSCMAPVVFDREISMRLFGPMLSAMRGASVARGESFLSTKLGHRILPRGFVLIEDPTIRRGHASRVCDGDGVTSRRRALIEDGVLTTWLLDWPAARRLKMESTGHAHGTSNLTVTPGSQDRTSLMRDAGCGLLVEDCFSPSVNPYSGDWSAGVSGYWFEGGEIAFPVSEITVAGCLPQIYPELVVGSDLEIRGAANSPSLLAPMLSVGGR